jgi:hypothetical protein
MRDDFITFESCPQIDQSIRRLIKYVSYEVQSQDIVIMGD